MRKVVLLIDSLIGGGAEKVVLNFAREFTKIGYEAHIILVKNKIDYDLRKLQVKIHYLSENGKLHRNRFINKIRLTSKLKRLILEIENSNDLPIDLIISSSEEMDYLGKKAQLKNFFIRYRNSMLAFYESKYKKFKGFKRFRRKLKYKLYFKYVYDNQNIITVSKAMEKDIVEGMSIKPKLIKTIYNPFDFEFIRSESKKNDKDLPQEKYLIYVARFTERKNQKLLIEAYHKSNTQYPLLLMGDTYTESDQEYLESLNNLIKKFNLSEKVIFTGFKKNPYPWIRNAELFIMSSNSEGLPLVLVEAMILNTKVISTDCPTGPSELLTGDLAKFLSPVGDSNKLARNIDIALTDYPPITEKRLQKFNSQYSVNEYLKLLK